MAFPLPENLSKALADTPGLAFAVLIGSRAQQTGLLDEARQRLLAGQTLNRLEKGGVLPARSDCRCNGSRIRFRQVGRVQS